MRLVLQSCHLDLEAGVFIFMLSQEAIEAGCKEEAILFAIESRKLSRELD